MSLISAGRFAEADGYVGYMEPYATSHGALDEDRAFQQEVRNAAHALGNAVKRQALVLGFSDAFAVLGIVLALAAVILLLTKRPKTAGGAGAH